MVFVLCMVHVVLGNLRLQSEFTKEKLECGGVIHRRSDLGELWVLLVVILFIFATFVAIVLLILLTFIVVITLLILLTFIVVIIYSSNNTTNILNIYSTSNSVLLLILLLN